MLRAVGEKFSPNKIGIEQYMYDINLDDKQRKIAEDGDGVVIIQAGPGTGKTKTLTSRVAYLILEKNIPPENILTLTFTKRAARQMEERLQTLVPKIPTITTFHGFAFDLLMQLGKEIKLISEEEREEIVKLIKKQLKSSLSTKEIGLQISRFKNSLQIKLTNHIKELVDNYQQEFKKRGLWDFDDLIVQAFNQLKSDDHLRQTFQKRFPYILIDEFQDTNDLQYQLVKLMVNQNPNLFVIGDLYQSIYGFRGANSQIFQTLKDDFPKFREEVLEINYRSNQSIVDMSNKLFPGQLKIVPHSSNLGRVGLIETLNEYTEADWVVQVITQKMGGVDLLKSKDEGFIEGITFNDFAIVYRNHGLSYALEQKLNESGLPFQIVKEDSYLEGDRIKLLSMHAAKGLEFKYVFICGFEEGLIPHKRSEGIEDELEEEKRLLYVGITRAKEELYLICTQRRNKQQSKISPFFALVDSDKLEKVKDEAIERIFQKREANKIKKSQMELF